MQGRPVESNKQIKSKFKNTNWKRVIFKVALDLLLLGAIFYAGHIFGDLFINNVCPPIDLVEKCYVNTNQGVMGIDSYLNMTKGVLG